jgi:hypothetical protein
MAKTGAARKRRRAARRTDVLGIGETGPTGGLRRPPAG